MKTDSIIEKHEIIERLEFLEYQRLSALSSKELYDEAVGWFLETDVQVMMPTREVEHVVLAEELSADWASYRHDDSMETLEELLKEAESRAS